MSEPVHEVAIGQRDLPGPGFADHPAHQEIYNLGFVVEDPTFCPQITDKHGFLRLTRDGEPYFGKYSKHDEDRRSSIENDVRWCRALGELAQRDPSFLLRAPEIVADGADWYVSRWIDGRLSNEAHNSSDGIVPYLDRYLESLLQLDAVDITSLSSQPNLYNEEATFYDDLTPAWDRWAALPLSTGLLTEDELQQARQIVEDYGQYVQPRLQHGDFVPWHIMIDQQEGWWIIDGEHASVVKPRYYDLAYMYTRIFCRMHNPPLAAEFLRGFAERSGEDLDSFWNQLLPVMTTRVMGNTYDAQNKLYSEDYRAEARDLLERCLSRDPARLFFA